MIINAIQHNHYCLSDANGKILELCFWCDTKTGRALHYEKTKNGIAYQGNKPKVIEKLHPAPLKYVVRSIEPSIN